MTKNELIEQAKILFPTGTKVRYRRTHIYEIGTINWENMPNYKYESPYIDRKETQIYLGIDEIGGSCRIIGYKDGKWGTEYINNIHLLIFN